MPIAHCLPVALCGPIIALGLGACDTGIEAIEVTRPVIVAQDGIAPTTTNLGYQITVEQLRTAIVDITFTVPGDGLALSATPNTEFMAAHTFATPRPLVAAIEHVLTAGPGLAGDGSYGHPGHVSGGLITGELPGSFIIDWASGNSAIGTANLLTGDYTGIDFGFRQVADTDDSTVPADAKLDDNDPLRGHSVHLIGRADRDGQRYHFEAVFDIDPETRVYDLPFVHRLGPDGSETAIELTLELVDADSGRSLLDDIEFSELPAREDATAESAQVVIAEGSEAANRLRRALQRHSHYRAQAR